MEHQIYEVGKVGYTKDEIVSSVIRIMHSGLRLKSILEMKSNLTVATLMGYLQHHHKEKSSSDLFPQLTSITEMSNKALLDFILRCIKIREKLSLTSKTSGEIEHDEVLISYLSLRSVERGILQEIRPVFMS